MKTLHDGHDKIPTTKTKAREYFFWVGMDEDITNFITQCEICQKYQRSNQKEPMRERELSTRPWQKIRADFFYLRGSNYLLIIDYFSKYVELEEMKYSTAYDFVHEKLRKTFSRHGFPDELVSDRGPPFNSFKFAETMKSYDIHHNPSTPRYPKSNGQVERTVQSIKISIEKAFDCGNDVYDVILNHNSTPHNHLPSPAELLFGRKIKGKNIMHTELLQPNYPIGHINQQLKENREKQKLYYDRQAKQLSDCNEGDNIWFQQQPQSHWKKGQVISADNKTRSYNIKTEAGKQFIRNHVFIRPNKSFNQNENQGPNSTVEDYYGLNFNTRKQQLPEEITASLSTENAAESDSSYESNNEGFVDSNAPINSSEMSTEEEPHLITQQHQTESSSDEENPVRRSNRSTKVPRRFEDFDLF